MGCTNTKAILTKKDIENFNQEKVDFYNKKLEFNNNLIEHQKNIEFQLTEFHKTVKEFKELKIEFNEVRDAYVKYIDERTDDALSLLKNNYENYLDKETKYKIAINSLKDVPMSIVLVSADF